MGYATVAPSSMLEVYSTMMTSVSVTNADTNIQLPDITVPSFKGQLTQAYLDVLWYGYKNTAAVENDVEDGHTYLSDGVNYWDAVTYPLAIYIVAASTQGWGYFLIPGANNLSSHIASNTTYHTWFYPIKCISNNLILRSVGVRLRLYFNVS